MRDDDIPRDAAPELQRLLARRFGDGLVYLLDARDRPLLARARRLGLVDEEGLITAAGRRFAARPAPAAAPRRRATRPAFLMLARFALATAP